MAKVIPFRGIFYNSKRVGNLKAVVTPPYDVIGAKEQDAFYESHSHNIIRLILGKEYAADSETYNRYTRAATAFEKWRREDILVRDEIPALYFTETDYRVHDRQVTRCGLIALVALEELASGVILPHERTFSVTRSERLRLVETCKANFSQIFALYPDQANRVCGHLKQETAGKMPDIDFKDSDGMCHRLWRVTDPGIADAVAAEMSEKPLYIADGHHRYETALSYRNSRLSENPALPEDAPCRYVMMYLSSMHDPGLTVLPAHRVVNSLPKAKTDSFLDKAAPFFDVEIFNGTDAKIRERAFLDSLAKSNSKKGTAVGVVMRNKEAFYVLRLRKGVMERLFADLLPGPLMRLDVTVVTQVFLKNILEFDETDLDNEENLSYTSKIPEAIDAVCKFGRAAAFIMNPTRIKEVQEIADARLVMPRKSTYFYPKVITGLVINRID
jgi:uncharacterized protein (DUF1015 family)